VIVVGSTNLSEPVVTKVKSLFKPKPHEELRAGMEKFTSVKSVTPAAGIKIIGKNLEYITPGAPLQVVYEKHELQNTINSIKSEFKIDIKLDEDGIGIKSDTLGGLEAIATELKSLNINIKNASIGDISKHDIINASMSKNLLYNVLLGFNVKVLPECREENKCKIIISDVIYKLIDEYIVWRDKKQQELNIEKRKVIDYPGKIKVLKGCIFRISKPAIVGVRVLSGEIKVSHNLISSDNKFVGKIKSIRDNDKILTTVAAGSEIAIGIEDCVVGKNINEESICYVDISESDVKKLQRDTTLTPEDSKILEEFIAIKRKTNKFFAI